MRTAMLGLLVVLLAAPAHAGRRRAVPGEKYAANGTIGLGLELGAPSGLNGKYFLAPTRALNFGIGWIEDGYYYDDRDGVHLYLDYLFHPFSLSNNPTFQLPFYVGVGGRLWDYDDHRKDDIDDAFALGVRCPVGLAFDFNKLPLDAFVQLTVVADLFLASDRNDRLGFHIEPSIGVRYWFY